jgi:hypothetical protein
MSTLSGIDNPAADVSYQNKMKQGKFLSTEMFELSK